MTVPKDPGAADKRWRAWRVVTRGAVALGLGFVILRTGASIAAHPHFAVESIEFPYEQVGRRTMAVLGQSRISNDELAAWVGFAAGTSLFSVQADRLRRRLEEHPWVHRADVTVHPPRRLVAKVRERRAVAVVRLDDLHYVDRRGTLIAPVGAHDSRDFPIITGVEQGFGLRSLRVALPRIASLLRRYEGARWIGAISEVHVGDDGGVIVFPMAAQVSIKLGRGGWFAKLARAERVLAARRGEAGQVVMIDVSSRAGVILRVRDEVAPRTGSGTAPPKTEV